MRMRPVIFLALALATITLGCGRSGFPIATAPGHDALGDPSAVTLTVAVSDHELDSGETIKIGVTATNPTDRRIVLHFSSGCALVFRVKDASGTDVGPEYYACTAALVDIEIAPHSSVSSQYLWNGTGFLRNILPAGDYSIIGSMSPDSGSQQSGPVLVRIVEP